MKTSDQHRSNLTIMSSLNRFFWLLKRPNLYPEALRRSQRKVENTFWPEGSTYTANSRAKAQEEATKWCEQYAIDTKTAITKITGLQEFEPFEQKFQEQLTRAREITENSPVKMGGGGNLELIYQLAEHLQARQVIETGVSYGWSSLTLLLSLSQRSNSHLISTDLPYFFEGSEQYVGCVVPSELKRFWTILPAADREALPQVLKILNVIDMAHYDSDKFYEGRMWAYPKLWNALKPGGILISDDIHDDFAFRDFSDSVGENPIIVQTPKSEDAKYVGILIKPNA